MSLRNSLLFFLHSSFRRQINALLNVYVKRTLYPAKALAYLLGVNLVLAESQMQDLDKLSSFTYNPLLTPLLLLHQLSKIRSRRAFKDLQIKIGHNG
ncbi:MAG: hypothetical protein ACI9NN_002244 [Bacteroidia bacterium]|jgi:hypothetical protein